MTRCLRDKALFMSLEGNGTDEQQSHLQSCEACRERYKQLRCDLDLIRDTLQQELPPARLRSSWFPLSSKMLPVAAALVVAIMLVWGQTRLWKKDSSIPSGQTFNSDLSQFLAEVSDAAFGGTEVRAAATVFPDPDFSFLQVALGERCSYGCVEVPFELVDETLAASPGEWPRRGLEAKGRKRER